MNFALSDEQEFLREAARGALSRFKTDRGRARGAREAPTRCPTSGRPRVEAGWPGLLISEEHGGAGLGAFDALLVAEECGRVLARRAAARAAARDGDPRRRRRRRSLAGGRRRRAAPGLRRRRARRATSSDGWTVDAAAGLARGPRRRRAVSTATRSRSPARAACVPDAPGADLLVVVGVDRAASRSRWSSTATPRRHRRAGHPLRRHALARPRDARRRDGHAARRRRRRRWPTPGTWRRR